MNDNYLAHINEYSGAKQTLREHSENTALLCREFAIQELKDYMYVIGMLHDVGKLRNSFQKRILGEKINVEHSICGASLAKDKYGKYLSLMMGYCIAGHHSGIPDGGFLNDTEDMSTLYGRLKRKFDDFPEKEIENMKFPELNEIEFALYLVKDCDNDKNKMVDKFAFLTRYAYSCLVDADSCDTADFCKEKELPRKLNVDLKKCLELVNKKLESFKVETELQKTRSVLQKQAFNNAKGDSEIFLLHMPTGSGKTLASIKVALERAIKGNKKRIIYIIPYTSIIDQTSIVFEEVFEDSMEILRHQSTFSYENNEDFDEDYRLAAKNATENWDAPFVLTTAVQFFESIYSNRRGKLRKLHNMADSILVFDEVHLMPQDFFQPCLQAVSYITKYLHSEAIFMTATMPDFKKYFYQYALPSSKLCNLIEDTSAFSAFKKCKYKFIGKKSDENLIEMSNYYSSSLIIVNKKKTARILYEKCKGKKYHLSTYMTAYDRERILEMIRNDLRKIEEDFPNQTEIPEERRITVFSTSLIEAGVDINMEVVFRETTGLDSILQSGGRCNREGKKEYGEVYIFDYEGGEKNIKTDDKTELTRGLIEKYKDISDEKCVREYYDRLYMMKYKDLEKNTMHCYTTKLENIPFNQYAERFQLIEAGTISLFISCINDESRRLFDELKDRRKIDTRKIQRYTCSVYRNELDDLIQQGVVNDYETGVFILTNDDYYNIDTGIQFSASDYIV